MDVVWDALHVATTAGGIKCCRKAREIFLLTWNQVLRNLKGKRKGERDGERREEGEKSEGESGGEREREREKERERGWGRQKERERESISKLNSASLINIFQSTDSPQLSHVCRWGYTPTVLYQRLEGHDSPMAWLAHLLNTQAFDLVLSQHNIIFQHLLKNWNHTNIILIPP